MLHLDVSVAFFFTSFGSMCEFKELRDDTTNSPNDESKKVKWGGYDREQGCYGRDGVVQSG